MKSNLLSVIKIQEKEYKFEFEKNMCMILQRNKVIIQCTREGNIFNLKCQPASKHSDGVALQAATHNDINIWYQRLGHYNYDALGNVSRSQYVEG